MMRLLSLFILSVLAKTEAYGPLDDRGSSLTDYYDTHTLEVADTAQRHPNATRAVAFKPFLGLESETGSTLSLRDVEWTWRVNISESSAPNAPGVDESVDAHIVTTTHDFTWPGSGNVPTELDKPNSGLCLTVADSPNDWPVNVTNAYTEDDADNPSCAPVLGQPCVDAILSSSRRNGLVGCNGPSTSWFHLPECQSTLGYTRGMSTPVGTFTQPYGFSNTSRNATDDQEHGKGFSPITLSSSPQDGSGSVEYYTTLNRLHIMLFNPIIPSNGESESTEATGYTQGPALLCMRVNTTQLPTGDTDGDGVTWTSEAVLESIGSSVNRSAVWVWSVVTFMSLTLAFAT